MTTNQIQAGSDSPASAVWRPNEGSLRTTDAWCPAKTAEGLAEIRQRHRRLTQRQRTMLLLVDGHRSAAQVKTLGLQAGATDTAFDELLELGLITAPPPATPVAPAPDAGAAAASESDAAAEPDAAAESDPTDEPDPVAEPDGGVFEQFELESDRLAEQGAPTPTHRVHTVVSALLPFLKSAIGEHGAHDVPITNDNVLDEARRTLVREVPARRH